MSHPEPVTLSYTYWPMKGTESHARRTADEPILILVHGLTSAAATFAAVGSRISAAAHVIAVDQRGHGKTPEVCGGDGNATTEDLVDRLMTVPTLANDLHHFITSVVFSNTPLLTFATDGGLPSSGATDGPSGGGFGTTPRPVHLLGHSWGARTVFAFADAHPELVASLISEDELIRAVKVDPPEDSDRAHLLKKVERAKHLARPYYDSESAAVAFCVQAMGAKVADYGRKVVPAAKDHPDKFVVLFRPHVALAWNRHAAQYDATRPWKTLPAPIQIMSAGDESSDIHMDDRHDINKEICAMEAAAADRRTAAAAAVEKALAQGGAAATEPHPGRRMLIVIAESSHPIHRTHPDEFVDAVCQWISNVVGHPAAPETDSGN